MSLHVVESVFICIQKLEVFVVDADGSSDIEILSCKVLRQLALKQLLAWLLYTTTLQKLTPEHTWYTTCKRGRDQRRECKQFFILLILKHYLFF